MWLRVFEPFAPRQIPQSHSCREFGVDFDVVEFDSETRGKAPSTAENALNLIEKLYPAKTVRAKRFRYEVVTLH